MNMRTKTTEYGTKTLEVYENVYVLYIKFNNETLIKEFNLPCYLDFDGRLIELQKDKLIEHFANYSNQEFIGDDFNLSLIHI